MEVHVSLWDPVFLSFRYIPRNDIAVFLILKIRKAFGQNFFNMRLLLDYSAI